MRLTSFSDYTLRVLMYLALERDRRVDAVVHTAQCPSSPPRTRAPM